MKINFEQCMDVRVVHVENEFATTTISLFGAQLPTWQPKRELYPVLWMSPMAKFNGRSAIRGGVPLCWPWFGKHSFTASVQSHGYVRLSVWELDSVEVLPDGRTEFVMALPPIMQKREYRCSGLSNPVQLVMGEVLDIQSTSRKNSGAELSVTEGFRTHLQIGDVANAEVTELYGCDYINLLSANQRRYQNENILFGEEVGRIFDSCQSVTAIEDRDHGRKIVISGQGSPSIAVWNPGHVTASKMEDLGELGWRTMVCVKSANASENQVKLKPHEAYTLAMTFCVEDLA